MEMQTVWVDRGQSFEADVEFNQAERIGVIAASRAGEIEVRAPLLSFWIVLRGMAEVEAREGHFRLNSRHWMLLDADSRPALYAGPGSLVLGLLLPPALHTRLRALLALELHAGQGRLPPAQLRLGLRLWRQAGAFEPGRRLQDIDAQQVIPMLRYLGALQQDLQKLVEHCPGRSLRRKNQVFDRMQRARLYLEGNVDRSVRLSELARLSNVSTWYFTKVFHGLYGEGPQAMAARLRLDHATNLLVATRMSVGEVGAVCGFENNCSFSRAFRERYGMPPSRYRLNNRAARTDFAKPGDTGGKAA